MRLFSSPEFTIGSVIYPSEAGLIAPGMSCIFKIQFNAVSLADYEDELKIINEENAFVVKLEAKKEHPKLSLETTLSKRLLGRSQQSLS